MGLTLVESRSKTAVPVTPVTPKSLDAWLKDGGKIARAWIRNTGFTGEPGEVCLVPGENGAVDRVLAGVDPVAPDGFYAWGALPRQLPAGLYRMDDPTGDWRPERAALGWGLGGYLYRSKLGAAGRKKSRPDDIARLIWPKGVDRKALTRVIKATTLVRELINTPTDGMGPAELAKAAEKLAKAHKAKFRTITGADLLKKNYPAIHAVGRAAGKGRAPRLIDFSWGNTKHPKVTLVGKGVCFDTGGLDIKPASAMKLMKKDMGGAAHVLGLAQMIMEAKLKVRLRVLIPAVENSVSGEAMRPMDVITSRNGTTIEIGHTDAEGRVILADALAEGATEKPDLMIDCATLTGAARVALGTDLPAMFCNDDEIAAALTEAAGREYDPLWRLPLWPGYRKMIDGKTADLTNSAESGYAGAITAALFLQEFAGKGTPWVHLDMMAWNTSNRPGRPEGGEAMGLRALFALIESKFGG